MDLDLHGKCNSCKYTAICNRDTHLMTLHKKNFDRVCARIKKKQLHIDQLFLKEIEQLKSLSKKVLNKISQLKKDVILQRGMFLYKEGDTNNDVFIVRSGQYIISKNLYISKKPENSEKIMLVNDTCIMKRY